MPKARSSYGGDRRRVRYGYLLSPEKQGQSARVTRRSRTQEPKQAPGQDASKPSTARPTPRPLTVWPTPRGALLEGGQRLSWLGLHRSLLRRRRSCTSKFDPQDTQNPTTSCSKVSRSIERVVMRLQGYASRARSATETSSLIELHGEPEQQLEPGRLTARRSQGVPTPARGTRRSCSGPEPVIASLNDALDGRLQPRRPLRVLHLPAGSPTS